ncbi:MAG: polyhydroxyalkanoate synthesis repressor PhaR [Pseudomonadota bacterium]
MASAKQNDKSAQQTRVIIKKYANRRLYNTAKSSYVTLEDLSRMVRAGEDFAVFDAKSGEEITRSVLTQIIFEEEAKGQNLLPINFLRQLIRLYGDALQGVVPGYLDASMDAFAKNQERMREMFGTGKAMANFEALARSNMEWMEHTMKMFTPFGAVPAKGEGADGAAPEATAEKPKEGAAKQDALDAMREQITEMQTQIEKLTRDQN